MPSSAYWCAVFKGCGAPRCPLDSSNCGFSGSLSSDYDPSSGSGYQFCDHGAPSRCPIFCLGCHGGSDAPTSGWDRSCCPRGSGAGYQRHRCPRPARGAFFDCWAASPAALRLPPRDVFALAVYSKFFSSSRYDSTKSVPLSQDSCNSPRRAAPPQPRGWGGEPGLLGLGWHEPPEAYDSLVPSPCSCSTYCGLRLSLQSFMNRQLYLCAGMELLLKAEAGLLL